jgi:hypothetical protein
MIGTFILRIQIVINDRYDKQPAKNGGFNTGDIHIGAGGYGLREHDRVRANG